MSMTLTWRKTTAHYTVLKWEGILQKADLPYEYVNAPGAKFWYTPSNRCIQFGGERGIECIASFPTRLYKGAVLSPEQHDSMVKYLTAAVNRLVVANKEKEMAETVVDEL